MSELEDFLGEDIRNDSIQFIEEYVQLIRNVNRKAAEIFLVLAKNKKYKDVGYVPILMIYRNIIDLTESIACQIQNKSIDPAKLQLRTVFESYLYLKFISEKNTLNRGKCFWVEYYYKKINLLKRSINGTQLNIQTKQIMKSDIYGSLVELPSYENQNDDIKSIESILNSDKFKSINDEFLRTKKNKGRAKWFQLYNGPRTIEKLAEYLNLGAIYLFIYRSLSENIHGFDVIDWKIFSLDHSQAEIVQIRNPRDVGFVIKYSISFALMSIQVILDNFISEEKNNYAKWYKDNAQKEIRKLQRIKFVTNKI